ncbi:hypothetical protein ADK77_38950 [Streptomyces antibioticus]|nr:hypothetical protein [Streptomyces antibioticus]KOG59690.1 hypothetical protein ADK77_38950 [Streptomyces antibioticus]
MIATADVLLPPAPRCPDYEAEAGRHTACPESSAWAAETPGDASGAVVHVALGLDPGDDAPAEAPAVLILEPVDAEEGTQEDRLMVEGADGVGVEQPQPGGVGEDTCAGAGAAWSEKSLWHTVSSPPSTGMPAVASCSRRNSRAAAVIWAADQSRGRKAMNTSPCWKLRISRPLASIPRSLGATSESTSSRCLSSRCT